MKSSFKIMKSSFRNKKMILAPEPKISAEASILNLLVMQDSRKGEEEVVAAVSHLALGTRQGISSSNSLGRPRKPWKRSNVTWETWRTFVGQPISISPSTTAASSSSSSSSLAGHPAPPAAPRSTRHATTERRTAASSSSSTAARRRRSSSPPPPPPPAAAAALFPPPPTPPLHPALETTTTPVIPASRPLLPTAVSRSNRGSGHGPRLPLPSFSLLLLVGNSLPAHGSELLPSLWSPPS